MSTNYESDALAEALFGDVRRAVLNTLFIQTDEPLYVREIIRRSGVGQGAVQRELKRLHAAGLLVREERGNQVYYLADQTSPVYEELRSLVAKTSGIAGVLRDALEPLEADLGWVGIFGSVARGETKTGSDVDVMVVGEADELDLHRAFMDAEGSLGRPVNYMVLTSGEYRERVDEPGFVRRVLAGEVIDVIGSRDV